MIRTSFLSCSCFFLPLVEVELELGVLLVTLLEEEVDDSNNEGGKEDEEGRSFFSLSA